MKLRDLVLLLTLCVPALAGAQSASPTAAPTATATPAAPGDNVSRPAPDAPKAAAPAQARAPQASPGLGDKALVVVLLLGICAAGLAVWLRAAASVIKPAWLTVKPLSCNLCLACWLGLAITLWFTAGSISFTLPALLLVAVLSSGITMTAFIVLEGAARLSFPAPPKEDDGYDEMLDVQPAWAEEPPRRGRPKKR